MLLYLWILAHLYLPVDRGGHLLLSSELQGVYDPQQLIKVPSSCCRVENGQLELLVRSDHKHLGGT